MRHGIVVERGHVRRTGGAKPLIDRLTETGITRILDNARSGRHAVPPDQALAAIIDDHQFVIWPCLPVERLYALQKPRIRGQGGNYHRYEEVRQSLILPCGRRDARYLGVTTRGFPGPLNVWFNRIARKFAE